MKRAVLAALVAAFAASCAQGRMSNRELEDMTWRYQREAMSRPEQSDCGMEAHRDLVGRDGESIDRASLPEGTRIICHDCMVTMDHIPARLNVQLGPDGKVASLRCG